MSRNLQAGQAETLASSWVQSTVSFCLLAVNSELELYVDPEGGGGGAEGLPVKSSTLL